MYQLLGLHLYSWLSPTETYLGCMFLLQEMVSRKERGRWALPSTHHVDMEVVSSGFPVD